MIKLILKNQLTHRFLWQMIKWHTKYYLFGLGTPVSAGVIITEACNSQCIMCNLWKLKKPSIYPRSAQEKAIDALSKIGCYYYSVGGGEPTLVKDLPDRLSYAARHIPYVRIITNGLLMTHELARALGQSGIKEVSISIDGSKDFHNIMRGRDNAFDKAWKSLELIYTHAPKVHIVVNSVITPYNLEGLRNLNHRLQKYPGVYQKYLPLTFHEAFGTQDLKSLPINLESATQSEIEKFLDEAKSSPRVINSPIFLEKAKLFFRGVYNLLPEQKRCLYPYHAMEFDPEGYAYPCRTGMNFKNGLSPEKDLLKYLNSSDYRETQKKLESCTKCHGSMMLCYYEPRLNFPLHNLLYYKFKK